MILLIEVIYLGEGAAKAQKKGNDKLLFDDQICESEFQLFLFPRFELQKWWKKYRPIKNNQFDGTMENERIAEKLRDPEAYYKNFKKISQVELENQLNKNKREKIYWMIGSGILLCLLVILVIKIVKIKKHKS